MDNLTILIVVLLCARDDRRRLASIRVTELEKERPPYTGRRGRPRLRYPVAADPSTTTERHGTPGEGGEQSQGCCRLGKSGRSWIATIIAWPIRSPFSRTMVAPTRFTRST
jgi:hypothetical protein